MAQSKEEIVRYVNEWIAQMKQKKHANTGQDFAEITLEEDHTAQRRSPRLPRCSACPIRRRGKSAAAF